MGSFFLIGLVLITFTAIFFTLIQTNEINLKINSEEVPSSIELFAIINLDEGRLIELIREAYLTKDETKLEEYFNENIRSKLDPSWTYHLDSQNNPKKEYFEVTNIESQKLLIPISQNENLIFFLVKKRSGIKLTL